MLLPKWFEHIYAMHVSEHIAHGLKSQVFAMRMTGLWPTTHDSPYYKWLTITIFLLQIVCPMSMLVVVVFADTIEEAINGVCLVVPCAFIAYQAVILYGQRDNIRRLSEILRATMPSDSHKAAKFYRIARINFLVHVSLSPLYFSTLCVIVVQSIISRPEDAFLTSTARWPFEFAQRRPIYWIVLMYQAMSIVWVGVWSAMVHSMLFALILLACEHVAQLKERLENMGIQQDSTHDDRDTAFYRDLIWCCQRYADCLR